MYQEDCTTYALLPTIRQSSITLIYYNSQLCSGIHVRTVPELCNTKTVLEHHNVLGLLLKSDNESSSIPKNTYRPQPRFPMPKINSDDTICVFDWLA